MGITNLDRLLRARGATRRTLARRIVKRGVPWQDWSQRFNVTVMQSPEATERAAHALENAARDADDDHAAARLRLMRGIALHRCGSPDEASRLLLDVEPQLSAHGDHERALQSMLLAIDALGHAGEIESALACARRAHARIRGPRAPLHRAILRANRANVLRLAGRLEDAARESDVAARQLQRLGHDASAAGAKMNAGVALMYAGHVRAARVRLEAAQAALDASDQTDRALQAAYNLACLDVRAGEPGAGIRELEALVETFTERGGARFAALCRMDLADALRRAGDAATAARQAKRAAEAFTRIGARAEAIEARWLAAAATVDADPVASRKHLRRAQREARDLGRPEFALRSELLLHDAALRAGRSVDGRVLSGLRTRAARLGQDEIAWQAQLLRVGMALEARQTTRARRQLDDVPRGAHGHPWISASVQAARARLDALEGDLGMSIRRLRALTKRMDTIRGGLPGAWLQTMFLLERLDPFLMLADALLERGRPQDRREAEEVLDDLALKRFLAGRSPRSVSGRLKSLRRRLEMLYDRIAEGGSTMRGLNPAQRAALIDEARSLEREVAEAWRAGERGGAVRRSSRVRVRGTSATTMVVHVWLRGDDVRALVRHGSTVTNLGSLAKLGDVRKQAFELQFHAHRVRATQSESAERALQRALQKLSGALLSPLAFDLGTSRLRLVIDARLPDLPWELLPLHGRPLAAQISLARLPAARMPHAPRRYAQGTRVVVSGEGTLAAVGREARHVAGGGSVLRGARATRAAARAALTECAVVHLAMHGVAAPHAPALGGVRMADGWFSAADVPSRAEAQLVSLAACQTGAPPSPAAQAWGALPHALLRAGVRWVLWTAGDVDDETTADLMSAFHPVSDFTRVPEMLGQALERVVTAQGTSARLLPFRLSGGHA